MSGLLLLLEDCSQGVQLLLQFGNSAIGLLLSLATRSCDDALPACLLTSATWQLGVCRVLVASHFQPSARFTRSWSLRVFAVSSLAVIVRTVCVCVLWNVVCARWWWIRRTRLVACTACGRCSCACLLGCVSLRCRVLVVWLRRRGCVCLWEGWRSLILDLWRRCGGSLVAAESWVNLRVLLLSAHGRESLIRSVSAGLSSSVVGVKTA